MIITKASHLDHGVTTRQLAYLLAHLADRAAFFIATIELPAELGTVPCGLFGPAMGDDPVPDCNVTMQARGTRAYKSRTIEWLTRPTNRVTVIAGPDDGQPCVLYTVFGGPLAPREPADIRSEMEELEELRRGTPGNPLPHTDPVWMEATEKIEKLRADRAESDAFWAQHALSFEAA